MVVYSRVVGYYYYYLLSIGCWWCLPPPLLPLLPLPDVVDLPSRCLCHLVVEERKQWLFAIKLLLLVDLQSRLVLGFGRYYIINDTYQFESCVFDVVVQMSRSLKTASIFLARPCFLVFQDHTLYSINSIRFGFSNWFGLIRLLLLERPIIGPLLCSLSLKLDLPRASQVYCCYFIPWCSIGNPDHTLLSMFIIMLTFFVGWDNSKHQLLVSCIGIWDSFECGGT